MNPEVRIGSYYWMQTNGSLWRCISSFHRPDGAYDWTMECLWHPDEPDKIGKKHIHRFARYMGPNWMMCGGTDTCVKYGMKLGRQWALFVLDPIPKPPWAKAYRVEIGSRWEMKDKSGGAHHEKLVAVVAGFARSHTAPSGTMYNLIDLSFEDDPYPNDTHGYDWKYFLKTFVPIEGPVGDAVTVCGKCNRDYPYAEPAVGFTCWGCKNGY